MIGLVKAATPTHEKRLKGPRKTIVQSLQPLE